MNKLIGKLVRFDNVGVGVVDVANEKQFIYFKPADIVGYRGETVKELVSQGPKRWTEGATVRIDAEKDASGNVHVHAVSLG
jgi:hypothetical protein